MHPKEQPATHVPDLLKATKDAGRNSSISNHLKMSIYLHQIYEIAITHATVVNHSMSTLLVRGEAGIFLCEFTYQSCKIIYHKELSTIIVKF